MRFDRFFAFIALALTSAVFVSSAASRAEPLLRGGIGLQTCQRLANDLRPGAGLDHLPNALLFYWVQGYLSAANIYLLNEYTDYVDIGEVKEPQITKLVADYCKANGNKRAVDALDRLIRETDKVSAKESDAFDPWEH